MKTKKIMTTEGAMLIMFCISFVISYILGYLPESSEWFKFSKSFYYYLILCFMVVITLKVIEISERLKKDKEMGIEEE